MPNKEDEAIKILAEKFGLSNRTTSCWKNGNNMPDISVPVELADFYNREKNKLFCR